MARFGHRSLGSIASVLALVGGMLLAPAPPVAALRTAEVAAKQAVADALAPLIEQAEAELQAATAERDAIVKRGRLT